ncbi:MAG: TonB-dependent receptor [Gammaproteobacteria bacterium]|nr:TonB-dependent receptor [Gammaproteobacteria bacterium]
MRLRHPLAVIGCLLTLPAAAVDLTDSMTVTAYRTPEAISRAGSSLDIIDQRELAARQDLFAADALRLTPGLTLARSGPAGAQTQLRMRGAEANHVLVMIDGVEANDLATADEFSFDHLTTFDIERIEVVRGPQSALWGSDALAGVINVVTRTPDAPLEAATYLEGGAFDLASGGARLGLRSGRAMLMASASALSTDGTNIARTGSEDDGYENVTGNLRTSFALTPDLKLDFGARHTDSTTEYDGIDSTTTGLPTDADNETDARQTYLGAGARLDLLDGRWSQQLRYTLTATDTDSTEENLATPARDYQARSTAGDRYGLHYQTSLRVTRGDDVTPGHLLTLAADHEREEFHQRGEIVDFYGTIYDPNQDQSQYATGIAAEYLAHFGPRLSLAASLRRDHYSDFDGATTWRTTASWTLPDAVTRLHGSFGTGQKAPTFVERYGFAPNQFVGNPDLEPETSQGWDAGIERRWLDGRLTTDLTYFRADLDDEIDGFYCPPPSFACTAINKDDESHRRGVEAVARAGFADRYTASLTYTYTDSEADDPNTPEVTRVREVRRPLHGGSIDLTGRWLDNRLGINASAAYTGSREDDFYPPPFFFPAERVTLDSYLLVRLAASYQLTPGLEIYGRIENVLDEDYEDVYGFNTPGFGAFAGVRLSLRR